MESLLLPLLKVQLLSTFGLNKALHAGGAERKKAISFSVIMCCTAGLLFVGMFFYCFLAAYAMEQMGMLHLFLPMAMAVASMIGLFTTIYKTNGTLFGYRDYDLLMALPVKSGTIVLSRVLVLYTVNFVFTMMVLLPAGVIYQIFAKPGLLFFLVYLPLLLVVPLIPIVAAAILGSLIMVISSRFRSSRVISLVLTLALVVGIVVLSTGSGQMSMEDLANMSAMLMGTINRIYPLAGLFGAAVCDFNVWAILAFAGLSIGVFLAFGVVLGRYYKRINTALTAHGTRSDYKVTSLRTATPASALYRREFKRYFASSIYVMNTIIGEILLLVACAALAVMGANRLEELLELPGFAAQLGAFAPLFMSVMLTMVSTTSASISMEGKTLWLVRSLPVSTEEVFKSKLKVSLTLQLPASLLSSAILAVVLRPSLPVCLLLFLTPVVYSCFITVAGLWANLKFPNFTWTTETTAVKQSAAVMVSMLAGFASSLIPLGLSFVLDSTLVTGGATILIAGLTLLLYRYLMKAGVRIFQSF